MYFLEGLTSPSYYQQHTAIASYITTALRGLIQVQRAYKIALNDGGKNRFCSSLNKTSNFNDAQGLAHTTALLFIEFCVINKL